MKIHSKALLTKFLTVPLIAAATHAESAENIRLELSNDVIFSSDNQFTNGTSVILSSKIANSLENTNGTPAFGKSLVAWAIPEQSGLNYRESLTIGQNIQTPANIEKSSLIENDVPYIGYLGWGNNFYAFNNDYFFGAQWLFGWVGEEALAEETQKSVHELIDGEDPNGWDNQLDFEPTLNGYLSFKRRYYQNSWFDAALTADLAAGNIMTFIQPGLELRFGDRPQGFHFIPDPIGRGMDYDATIFPSPRTYIYASATFRATYFAWSMPFEGNLFIDNDWTDRNTVDINRFVGQGILGLHWEGPRFGAHLSFLFTTPTVEEDNLPPSEDSRNNFGSLMVEYRF
ncbi:lipid A deacylase LpxR family protein [Halomonas vilamensis]|uniref:Lipid A deacylase LpxR family protein n=1 Tax=Vreelandella vilamensis TaxID=531309 RepID=A0ABU1H285_9GAMM|nr:lipid A deacylase LpxR family protein [Halomonas vilamensis]MDR5897857.1 lipid A deacylase LpxR family protein [Halomonas vilamensis]